MFTQTVPAGLRPAVRIEVLSGRWLFGPEAGCLRKPVPTGLGPAVRIEALSGRWLFGPEAGCLRKPCPLACGRPSAPEP